MSLFKKAEHQQAYLKAGVMGLAGSGKTYTSSEIAIGLVEHMRTKNLAIGAKPVAFMDTETGSDWCLPRFSAANIDLIVNRSRALVDLRDAIIEAEEHCSVLIIDSITHFWRVFCEEYAERKGRKRGLEFSDWAFLKREWGIFTDLFVNSKLHIIMCGRQGYEYDFMERDDGKKELVKTAVKMKAEGETGFEPSILIAMEQVHEMKLGEIVAVHRVAKILKDRSTRLDGKEIKNPTFRDFLPHIECLNLGGVHAAIDGSDNASIFTDDGTPKWVKDKQEKTIVLDEIVEVLGKHHGGSGKEAKDERAKLAEEVFGTRSWERIQTLTLEVLQTGRNKLWLKLEGVAYSFVPPATVVAVPEVKTDAA